MKYKAIVYDAFGTIFNLDSSRIESLHIPMSDHILAYAREHQLAYTWQYSLMQAYVSFDKITQQVIADGCRKFNVVSDHVDTLCSLYMSPVVYEDVIPSLEKMKSLEVPHYILSNGTPAMLKSGIQINHLEAFFDGFYSADAIRRYKPDPRVYAMVNQSLKCRPEEILFISSNQWDAVGAEEYGYEVLWLNRNQSFRESYTLSARIHEIESMLEIINHVPA